MQDNPLEYAEKLAESGLIKRRCLIDLDLGQLKLPDGSKTVYDFRLWYKDFKNHGTYCLGTKL